MKRMILILFCLCFLCGVSCIKIEVQLPENTSEPVQIIEATDAPTEAPSPESVIDVPTAEPAEEPTDALPQVFFAYQDMEDGATEAVMYDFDWDFDGEEESISVSLDWEADTATISDGKRSITLEISAMLVNTILIDLDPDTPYANLVVCIDEASDDYVTVVLHPEGDQIVSSEKKYIGCSLNAETCALIGWERMDLLGTGDGERVYEGEDLTPKSEWLECWTPSEEELKTERESLIEGGTLLHAVRDVPCVIDGDPDVIPAGSYVYRVRFHEARDSVEVCLEDGRIAEIVFDHAGEDEAFVWPLTIDGIDQEQYFDNLLFAD